MRSPCLQWQGFGNGSAKAALMAKGVHNDWYRCRLVRREPCSSKKGWVGRAIETEVARRFEVTLSSAYAEQQ